MRELLMLEIPVLLSAVTILYSEYTSKALTSTTFFEDILLQL